MLPRNNRKKILALLILLALLLLSADQLLLLAHTSDQSIFLAAQNFPAQKLILMDRQLAMRKLNPEPKKTKTPTLTPTMPPLPTPTMSPTPTPTPTSLPGATPSPTSPIGPTPTNSPTPASTPTSLPSPVSVQSPCFEINTTTSCSSLPGLAPYNYPAGTTLTITGYHWNTDVQIVLYLIGSPFSDTSHPASLALLSFAQTPCPPVMTLNKDAIAHSSTHTDNRGSFSVLLTFPSLMNQNITYDVCAVNPDGKPIIPSQKSESILLFRNTPASATVSPPRNQPANAGSSSDFFASSLSVLALILAIFALLIYFFAPRRYP